MRLLCSGCGSEHQVDKWDGSLWSLCESCHELAQKWSEERKRDARALAEERLASPRYSAVCAWRYATSTGAGTLAAAQTDE